MYDVVVIGSGPGGYVAAIRSAQLGMKTAIIESQDLGGICLNWGCIPTKALLRSAEIYRNILHSDSFGIKTSNISFDLQKIIERSRLIARKLSNGVNFLLKNNNITYLHGWGSIKETGKVHSIEITNNNKKEIINSKNIILATGARARVIPNVKLDHKVIWDYKDALKNIFFPKSMLIIGSGAIGIEFASFFSTFSVDITIVEMQSFILPTEDREISTLARKKFEKESIKILTDTIVEKVYCTNNCATVLLKNKNDTKTLTFDRVLSAAGIVGNVENIGLENTKIQVQNTHIIVNKYNETNESGIYAIGDVAGAPWLAHKASHEGMICAEHIAGKKTHPLNVLRIPSCVYSNPQIASIGLTEEEAKKRGFVIKIGRFPFLANGKALALGDDQGLIKTIFDSKTGELLGAHMIGAEVTELIQGYAIAQTLETTESELIDTIFPHPTLSEMIHESVLNAYGRSIHI